VDRSFNTQLLNSNAHAQQCCFCRAGNQEPGPVLSSVGFWVEGGVD
jgi:hypothetical protein